MNGTDLDRCIAISPTWNENHRFTDAIRQRLKQRRLLGDGVSITVCNQLDWTKEQKKSADNFRTGMLLTFNADNKSPLGGKTFEVERIVNGELWLKGRSNPINAESYAHKFSVSLPREIELAEGDKILIRRNHHEAGLINGKVLTVEKINADGSIKTREGKNIPSEFRHFAHGYVVTSYKSQGRTHDHEIVAAESLDAKTAYVALSRGKQSACVFTPDKKNLFEKLGKPSDRLAAMDVFSETRVGFWREDEERAFRDCVKDQMLSAAFNHDNSVGHEQETGVDYANNIKQEPGVDYANNVTQNHENRTNHTTRVNYENDFSI